MPVDFKHPLYEKYQERWMKCRDASDGEESVKKAGGMYLPPLTGMKTEKYDAYRKRALWYGATGRTIDGLRGAVFRKDPKIEVPGNLDEEALNSVTDDNLDFISLASEVVTQQLTVGRIGLLVDVPTEGNTEAPYVSRYDAENIINWQTEVVDGREFLSMVVLQEKYMVQGRDEYEMVQKIRHRVLKMEDGRYIQKVIDEKGVEETFEPKRKGAFLDFVPFRFVNSTTLTAAPEKPPLIDLVNVNLSHYRTSADLEHGAHFTALPTPWLAGFNMKNEFSIGSGVAFVTDNVQARAGMLEFTGKGLDTLIVIKGNKEKLMAVLGARLLEESKKGVEAADTVRLNHSGESGSLAAITNNASRGLTDILNWMTWWRGASAEPIGAEGVVCELNNDFLDERLSPQEITALMQAYQSNSISQEMWLYNLERGELFPPGHTIQDEMDLVAVQSGRPDDKEIEETGLKLVDKTVNE